MSKLDRSKLIKAGKVSIEGLDALLQTFKDLSGGKSDTKLVSAMRYALVPLQKQMKANAPRLRTNKNKDGRTGLLRKAIAVKARKYGRGKNKKIVGLVGPKFSDVGTRPNGKKKLPPHKYAHLVERGAAPHRIIRKTKTGEVSWMHPGAKAKPFMKPALDSVGSQIFNRFAEKMKEIISKIGVKK
jgi:HK97 gp10 family phage protein